MNVFDVLRRPDEYRYNRHVFSRRNQMTRAQMKIEQEREALSHRQYHSRGRIWKLYKVWTYAKFEGIRYYHPTYVAIQAILADEGIGL